MTTLRMRRALRKNDIVMITSCTFGRHGPVAVPVVAVRGRQLVQFRLVPDEHVLGAGRPVVGEARGRRRASASATSAGAAAARAAAAAAARASASTAATAAAAVARGDASAAERRLLLLLVIGPVDGDVHAGHEADAGLFLGGGLYPAAAAAPAVPPAAARHQRRGPPPDDDGLPLQQHTVPDSRRSRQRIG